MVPNEIQKPPLLGIRVLLESHDILNKRDTELPIRMLAITRRLGVQDAYSISQRLASNSPFTMNYPLKVTLDTSRTLSLSDLQELCPSATGSVWYPCLSSGEWVCATIGAAGVVIPRGPLLCGRHEGVNLGRGFGVGGGLLNLEPARTGGSQSHPDTKIEAVESLISALESEGGRVVRFTSHDSMGASAPRPHRRRLPQAAHRALVRSGSDESRKWGKDAICRPC